MKKVIVINGPATVGKGTFINACRLFLLPENTKVYSFSSIFTVKDEIFKLGLWDGKTKEEADRNLMIKYKKKQIEEGDKPLNYLLNKIKTSEDNSLIFVHIREAEEIKKFLNTLQDQQQIVAKTMHIDRKGKRTLNTTAETGTRFFKNYDYDYIVDKDGFNYLIENFVKVFLQDEFPDFVFGKINENDVNNSKLHLEFYDELKAGYA